jgi:hypothetical protein
MIRFDENYEVWLKLNFNGFPQSLQAIVFWTPGIAPSHTAHLSLPACTRDSVTLPYNQPLGRYRLKPSIALCKTKAPGLQDVVASHEDSQLSTARGWTAARPSQNYTCRYTRKPVNDNVRWQVQRVRFTVEVEKTRNSRVTAGKRRFFSFGMFQRPRTAKCFNISCCYFSAKVL